MKRFLSVFLLVVLTLVSSISIGETPIEQVQFEEQTVLLGIVPIKETFGVIYSTFIIVYLDGKLVPVDTISSKKIREGYIASEEYLSDIIDIRDNPVVPVAEPLTPPKDELIILLSAEPIEGRFEVYAFLKDFSIVKFSSFPEVWVKSNIKIEDFLDFLIIEVNLSEEYEPNIGEESVIFEIRPGKGFFFPNSKGFITNSLILTSFDTLYFLKIGKRS